MKISNYVKCNGIQKICEKCNWDLRDIRLHIIRECNISGKKDLSRIMREFKLFIKNSTEEIRSNKRMNEFLMKLKGEQQ